MAETSLPNPGSTTIYFIAITIALIAYTIFNIKRATTFSDVSARSETIPTNIIYILTIIIGSYFINVAVSKALCSSQSIQWGYVLLITLLPWVIIFVTLYGIPSFVPSKDRLPKVIPLVPYIPSLESRRITLPVVEEA